MNKQQIILLALLVSFVSSIATAVSVVSLMQQDQTVPVTQTINHVIEKTIERVSSDNSNTPSVVTKETVIVKDDQAVVNAIDTVSKGIVNIFWSNPGSTERFVGLGLIASSTGKILAKTEVQYGGIYTAHLAGGNSVPLTFISYDSTHGMSIFQAQQSTNPQDARVYSAVKFAEDSALKVGQAIVVIANSESPSVATGIISSFDQVQQIIHTSVKDIDLRDPAFLINLSGEILGIRGLSTFDGGFIPDSIIKTYATP